jgi:hypothetical protein
MIKCPERVSVMCTAPGTRRREVILGRRLRSIKLAAAKSGGA